jgi:hypothetical protein
MSPSTASSAAIFATSAEPRLLWNEIVRWTFEACILRREGDETKVTELLHDRLPTLIHAWSRGCGQSADACKQQLRALFSRAQESVEIGFIHRRLIVKEVCSRLGAGARVPNPGDQASPREGRPTEPAGVHLRRRIPLDDVPKMLDALAEAEAEAFGESILPIRRSVAPTVTHFAEVPPAQLALSA